MKHLSLRIAVALLLAGAPSILMAAEPTQPARAARPTQPAAVEPAPDEQTTYVEPPRRKTLKKEAIQSTVNAISDVSLGLEKRIDAIGLAALTDMQEAVAPLTAILRQNDAIEVKVAAAWALREINDPRAIPALLYVHGQATGPSPTLKYADTIEFPDGSRMDFVELIEDSIGRLGESQLSRYLQILNTTPALYVDPERQIARQRAALAVVTCVGDRDFRAVDYMRQMLANSPDLVPRDFREMAAIGLARVLVHRAKEFQNIRGQDRMSESVTETLINYLITIEPSATRETVIAAVNQARPDYAVTLLTRHFADNSPENVRLRTIELLGMLRSRESVEALVFALENEKNPELRWRAAFGLGLTGQKDLASPALRKAAKDPSPLVRRAAIESLGRLGVADVVALIKPALADTDPQTRAAAVRALAMLHQRDTLPLLVTAAADKDVIVRTTAVAALGAIPSRESLAVLIKSADDTEYPIRLIAANVLAVIVSDPKSDIEAVREACVPLLRLQADPDRAIRLRAKAAIQRIALLRPDGLKKAVIQVITDPKNPASADACDVAASLRGPEIIEALKTASSDARPAVRAGALRALQQLGVDR